MDTINIANSWIEIDSHALLQNIAFLMEQGSNRSKRAILMVKANAYGHGLREVANIVAGSTISMFAVASLKDAIILRNAGVTQQILVVGSMSEGNLDLYKKLNLTVTIDSFTALDHIVKSKAPCDFHIKIDTGLHRYGFSALDIALLMKRLQKHSLKPSGIYTHFSEANTNIMRTKEEFAAFQKALHIFQAQGFTFDYVHASNSAGALWLDESLTNAVRLGLAVYGLQPNPHKPVDVQPCLSWKTRIDAVRSLDVGETVGYGQSWRADRKTRIAILTVGYSDGFRSRPKRQQTVLCRGHVIPIVGTIMMNNTVIDITDYQDVRIGDIVTLIGKDDRERITAEDVARQIDTINEEVVSQIQVSLERKIVTI